MEQGYIRVSLGKLILTIMMVIFMLASIFYLYQKYSRIRDIKRLADANTIINALQVYYNLYGEYPQSSNDDGRGWDNSNDLSGNNFLEPLVDSNLLVDGPYDPKNQGDYYYRYQKFPAGSFGCRRSFAIFQIMGFETKDFDFGEGQCPKMNFITQAPAGFTWQDFE